MATYRLIGLVFVLVLAAACGSADGSDPSEESNTSSGALQETVMISVADGCATLTDPGSGSELVTSCQPPLSNPLFVWGDDTAATSVNLIRVPPGTGFERTEGDSFNASYDMAEAPRDRCASATELPALPVRLRAGGLCHIPSAAGQRKPCVWSSPNVHATTTLTVVGDEGGLARRRY